MDVVIFQIQDQLYAFDAGAVREIIDPLPVTPLPFSAVEVEGLINVSGTIILQICTARRLQQGVVAVPEGGAVIILALAHDLCACRVTRVLARATVTTDAVAAVAGIDSANHDALLNGEFLWKESLVLLLDPAFLLRERISGAESGNGAEEGSGLVTERYGGDLLQDAHHADDFPCVVFCCNNEFFAVRFADVAEVVESGAITPLPGAPQEIPGAMLLRGAPLPLLSLQSILFGGTGSSAMPFTVIVHLNCCRVGLLVERVVGIQRFARSSLRPLPEEQTFLEGIITTGDNRMLALIRLSSLAAAERFDAWRPWLLSGAETPGGNGLCPADPAITIRMLLFRQGRELLALPLEMIERIEEYSEPTATPGDETEQLGGVIQVQGNIMPVCSAGKLLGGISGGPPCVYLVVSNSGKRCALAVEKVECVVTMNAADMEPAPSGSNGFLSGIGTWHGTLVSLVNGERLVA